VVGPPSRVYVGIPLSQDEPLFRQVYCGLRRATLAGTFRAGERLPSTRDLAEQLGISRTVVVLAYEQLLAEAFAVGRSGSGTYVREGLSAGRPGAPERAASLRLSRFGSFAAGIGPAVGFPEPRAPLRYDFAYGRSDVDCFPFEPWRR